jgi:hypothetical protein
MILPTEIIHNILSYSDNIRVLKIKMNKSNIKYLFDNDRQICGYLYAKTRTFTPCLNESLYLTLINILNDKSIIIKNVYNSIITHIIKYKIHFEYYNYELYDSMLDIIINDYNEYYLNDYYYYNGYWYDGEWISTNHDKIETV